jgi:hypothetical protein
MEEIAPLFQVPLSPASVTAATGTPGTQVTLRGSGFQNGATLTFAMSLVSATYVDQNNTYGPGASVVNWTVSNPPSLIQTEARISSMSPSQSSDWGCVFCL